MLLVVTCCYWQRRLEMSSVRFVTVNNVTFLARTRITQTITLHLLMKSNFVCIEPVENRS